MWLMAWMARLCSWMFPALAGPGINPLAPHWGESFATVRIDSGGSAKTCADCLLPIAGPALVRISGDGMQRSYHHLHNCRVYSDERCGAVGDARASHE